MTYTVVVLPKAEKYLIKLEEKIFDNYSAPFQATRIKRGNMDLRHTLQPENSFVSTGN